MAAASRLRAVARAALIAGAAGSIALMLRAGQRQRSVLLILLFTGWVLSPFLGLALANLRAPRWAPRVRTALHVAMIAVAAAALAIYAFHAATGAGKPGFVYLVGPAACWVIAIGTVGTAAATGR